MPAGWAAFYRVVRRIPRGRVATYGTIAMLTGKPRSARHVGFALAALRDDSVGVPWHRVLGARSRAFAAISLRDAVGGTRQRLLLENEGVVFDAKGRVALATFGWPVVPTRKTPRSR